MRGNQKRQKAATDNFSSDSNQVVLTHADKLTVVLSNVEPRLANI